MEKREKIKKGLEYCIPRHVDGRWISCYTKCPYNAEGIGCRGALSLDIKAYIQQLETENAALKKDLSVADADCSYCKYALENNPKCEPTDGDCGNCEHWKTCPCTTCTREDYHWEWRGLREETKEARSLDGWRKREMEYKGYVDISSADAVKECAKTPIEIVYDCWIRKQLEGMNAYQQLAARTSNTTGEDKICNGCLGLAGECGEVIDLYKKHRFQGHMLDKEKMVEELGDVLWYCAEIASGLGVELGEVARRNVEKLRKRYPDGFDADKSVNREG